MDSQSVLFSAGRNDECYTPRYVVQAIEPYLPKDKVIWCPFDTSDSAFVSVLTETGHKVIYSHISMGKDYYKWEPGSWDIMVSNPPFTKKRRVFERALAFDKPFALLMSLTWLNDSAPKVLFMERDLELMLFRNRVKFLNSDGMPIDNKITFASGFYCSGILPRQIIMVNR